MSFALGKKIEMTQVFTDDGRVLPVTVLDVNDVKVIGTRTEGKDGYNAVILGFGKKRKPTKSEQGKYKKIGYVPFFIAEFRVDSLEGYEAGEDLKLGTFKEGSKVNISGITKGKGFQGVVKKYGFAGGPKTRGQSDRQRAPGSIGSGTTPGRVYKGKKMPGHMGNVSRTIKNLELVKIDADNKYILVKGAVPGNKGSIVKIKQN
jgi:large subunit ribosomal protein L3